MAPRCSRAAHAHYARLLALAASLLGGTDRRLVGLGAGGVAGELLHEAGGGLEGAREGALGDLVPDVELGLVRLEDGLDGGDGLDEELVLGVLHQEGVIGWFEEIVACARTAIGADWA